MLEDRQTVQRPKKALRVLLVTVGFFLSALPAAAQVNTSIEGIALSDRSPVEIALYLISWFLGILAIIAVVLVLYGGFMWMTSGGNEEKIERAKLILKNALIGLVIILAAWGIVLYVLRILSGATGTGAFTGNNGSGCVGCSVPTGGSDFYVQSTNPEAGETGVYLCYDVTVRMSRNIDKTTVTPDTFYLQVLGGSPAGATCVTDNQCSSSLCGSGTCVGSTVAGEIGFGPGDSTRYFNLVPDEDLAQNTTYQATVVGGSSGVLSEDETPEDSTDDRLAMNANYVWTYTTGSETDVIPPTVQITPSSPYPADGATNVCRNTVINFDFSESMRITSFNDDVSYVLDAAGTTASPVVPDWAEPNDLKNWNFGGDFDFAQARPKNVLNAFALYSTRLFGGDPANNFAGALQDSCGNPLDGDADELAEGSTVDNFLGWDPASFSTGEDPITWETGDTTECTPVVDGFSPGADYYGEYSGLPAGESCTVNSECGSGVCGVGSICVGFAPTSLTITGQNLAPHPEIQFEGSTVWASEDFNTCFNEDELGNVETNTAMGDVCLYDGEQSLTQILMRTPVGSADTPIRVSVAEELSDPSTGVLDVLSPQIQWLDPNNGSVGQFVTISGQNFGEVTGTVLMRSADGTRESTVSLPEACSDVWSDTEIVVIIPETYTNTVTGEEGTWESGDLGYIQVINASNSRYSDLQLFTFNEIVRPNLCSIVPNCAENAPQSFTATGEHFGDEQGESLVNFSIDSATGYSASISSWNDLEIQGNTHPSMSQEEYWVTVYDAENELNSNGRSYDIPCSIGPNVVNISQCNQAESVYPVPNPQPNETEACLNANVGVLFDQPMNTSTLNSGNIYLEQFNSGTSFDASYAPLPVSGYFQTTTWSYVYESETYYGFQYNIAQTSVDADQDSVADGPTSAYLQPNTWYQLTITTGVTNSSNVNMASTYTMRFKSDNTTELCDVDTIDVAPLSSIQNSYWDPVLNDVSRENYTASPYAADCSLLDADSYSWDWTIDNTNIGNFGTGPNNDNTENVYVSGNTAANVGETDVNAAVDSITDAANFEVDLGFCTSDEDCNSCAGSVCGDNSHCTPVINNFAPVNGDHGTWVTVNGCMFGPDKGNLYWNSTNNAINAETAWPDEAQCGNTWTSTQIIAQVPDQYDTDNDDVPDTALPEQPYNIEVETMFGDTVESGGQFTVNSTVRPGICLIDPNAAEEGASVVVEGQALGTDEGFASFLDDSDVVDPAGETDRLAASADATVWSNDQVDTEVPAGAAPGLSIAGEDGFIAVVSGGDVQCLNDAYCSNSLDFTVSCNANNDCGTGCCSSAGICSPASVCAVCTTDEECSANGQCSGSECDNGSCTPVINELVPNQGPTAAPTTIAGCYFGAYGSGSGVQFNGIEAALLCGPNGWTDTSIIAEVPSGLTVGSAADVTVATSAGLSVTETDAYTLLNECAPGVPVPSGGVPVLCNLVPATGGTPTSSIPGTTVLFQGERFVSSTSLAISSATVDKFPENQTGDNFIFIDSEETSADVPTGAVSGFATTEVDSCPSNGQPFGVTCETAEQCPEQAYCINGFCTIDPNGCYSDEDCGSGNACVIDPNGNFCSPRPDIADTLPTDGASNVCPNALFEVEFTQPMAGLDNMFFRELQPDAGGDLQEVSTFPISSTVSISSAANGNSIVHFSAGAPFPDPTSTYQLVIPSELDGSLIDVRNNAYGLVLTENTTTVQFTITPNDCLPSSIDLNNNENSSPFFMFTSPEQTTTFTATMLASDGQPLAPTDSVGWDFTWSPYYDENACNNVAWVDLTADEEAADGPAATAETQSVVSGSENSATDTLSVIANPTPTSTWTGPLGPATAQLNTFFCDPTELWEYNDDPNHPSFISHAFPQHFRVLYCNTEELPTLAPPAIVEGGTNDDWFLQYLFVDAQAQDEAFGVRVYDNAANLTPLEWYDQNVPQPGSPKEIEIDGYTAVKDGLSYYIGASNILTGVDADGNGLDDIYHNIYLFTFNDNPGIAGVADQVVENLIFNTNPSVSYAQCEGSDKQKLVRDTKRIGDITSIVNASNTVFNSTGDFPQAQSADFGSYIQALTTSVWPSWQGALGNIIGQSLPTDPYNIHYASDQDDPWNGGDTPWVYDGAGTVQDCEYNPDANVYYDESGTCWDPVNNQYFCPNNSHTYLYIRQPSAPDTAQIYARMEYNNTGTENYSTSSTLYNPCTGIANADCSCFNFGLTSPAAAAGEWTPVP